MAIYFQCLCGQSLRAEDGRLDLPTQCPACCRFVRAPSLERANQALGIDAAPMEATPAVALVVPPMPMVTVKLVEEIRTPPRQRAYLAEDDDRSAYALCETPDDDPAERKRKQRDRKEVRRLLNQAHQDMAQRRQPVCRWPLETHGYEYLNYPLRALPLVFALAVAWATETAFIVAILPDQMELAEIVSRSPLVLIFLVLFGYTVAFLQATLATAMTGQAGFVAWPGSDLAAATRGSAQAVVCFLAGPIVPASLAFFFWLDSGDLQVVDWLILAELGILAIGYWALALMAVQQDNRFADANPVAVVNLVKRLGYRVPVAALVIAVVVFGHGLLMLRAVEDLHRGLRGWFALVGCFAGLLLWLLFILRWFGVSSFHARKARKKAKPSGWSAVSPGWQ